MVREVQPTATVGSGRGRRKLERGQVQSTRHSTLDSRHCDGLLLLDPAVPAPYREQDQTVPVPGAERPSHLPMLECASMYKVLCMVCTHIGSKRSSPCLPNLGQVSEAWPGCTLCMLCLCKCRRPSPVMPKDAVKTGGRGPPGVEHSTAVHLLRCQWLADRAPAGA